MLANGEMAGVAQLRFAVEGGGEVSALLLRPAQARRLLVMAHGSSEEMTRAKAILGTANAARIDAHAGANAAEPADLLAHANG